jgi:CO dehydrogenase/acetyl-CoA synthase beta subunit
MDPMEFSMLEEPNEGEEEEEEEAEEEEEEEKKTISKMLKFEWNLVHFVAGRPYHQQVRLRNQQFMIELNP